MMPHPTTADPIRDSILKAASSIGLLGAGAHQSSAIMAALCDPDVGARQIGALVGREPALYARVLRVANSPYYGQSRSITTVDRALVLLGLDAVRGIVAAACLQRAFPRRKDHALVDMNRLVQHSIATAAAADMLARQRHRPLAADAFIAGLLHNLGVVIQVAIDAPGVEAIVGRRRTGDSRPIRELERELACVAHEDCVAIVFEAWHLPEALIAATQHHHHPMDAPMARRDLAALVHLGGALAIAGGNTFELERSPDADAATVAGEHLGLAAAELEAIAQNLPGQVTALSGALLDPA